MTEHIGGDQPLDVAVTQALNASGLWASYGDFARAIGWGEHGARGAGRANITLGARLALNDGTASPTERPAPTRAARNGTGISSPQWNHADPVMCVNDVFGYYDGPGVQWPDSWRASVTDLRRLVGAEPMTERLVNRLNRRLALAAVLAADSADPRCEAARHAVQALTGLLHTLGVDGQQAA